MSVTNRAGQPIEAKPVAGLSTNAVVGYLIALVFAIWPNFASRIPDDLKLQLPVVIGTVLGAVASYYARHTNRPDLQPVVPPAEPVAPVASAGVGGPDIQRNVQ